MKYRQTWHVAALMAISLVAIRACSADEAFTPTPPPPDDLGKICSFNADCAYYCTAALQGMAYHCTRNCNIETPCPDGYVCVSGDGALGKVCTMGACTSDEQCPQDYSCDTETNLCHHVDIPCGVDDDCPGATACNQGTCETLCTTDDDCKQGWMCRYEARCVLCTHNTDCVGGFACSSGQCNNACAADSDCRTGFECVDAACEPIVGGGPGVVGESCDEHSECAAFCYSYQCNQLCQLDNPDSCPAGYHCHENHLVCHPD